MHRLIIIIFKTNKKLKIFRFRKEERRVNVLPFCFPLRFQLHKFKITEIDIRLIYNLCRRLFHNFLIEMILGSFKKCWSPAEFLLRGKKRERENKYDLIRSLKHRPFLGSWTHSLNTRILNFTRLKNFFPSEGDKVIILTNLLNVARHREIFSSV